MRHCPTSRDRQEYLRVLQLSSIFNFGQVRERRGLFSPELRHESCGHQRSDNTAVSQPQQQHLAASVTWVMWTSVLWLHCRLSVSDLSSSAVCLCVCVWYFRNLKSIFIILAHIFKQSLSSLSADLSQLSSQLASQLSYINMSEPKIHHLVLHTWLDNRRVLWPRFYFEHLKDILQLMHNARHIS